LLGPREHEVFADEVRFSDGTRVHIVLPPLAPEGPVLTIRKPSSYHPSLDDLVGQGVLSAGMAEFLRRAVQSGRSIAVAGPASSGKSTMLGALTSLITSGVRVVAVEETRQLPLSANAVRLEASPATGFDMRFLLRSALSMHPERVVLDECRGPEGYDWVTSTASGTEGSMIALHGTTAADALGRLESLALMGSTDVSPRGLREQVARAVDFVVVVHGSGRGFRVNQITEVQGVDLDTLRLNDVFYYRVEGTAGAFHPTGYVPLFYEDLRHAGVDADFGIFRE
jgi:pilus assembly protein CpaF